MSTINLTEFAALMGAFWTWTIVFYAVWKMGQQWIKAMSLIERIAEDARVRQQVGIGKYQW